MLVNDDGIDAPGFSVLKKIAEKISKEIWIFAPVEYLEALSLPRLCRK